MSGRISIYSGITAVLKLLYQLEVSKLYLKYIKTYDTK